MINLWSLPELIPHQESHYKYKQKKKKISSVLISSPCDLCIHMSQSEKQSCRVSWAPSEASSWAEYEHKWCFHSTLPSAVWILPQDLISMAVASSPIPGLYFSTCAFVDAHAPSSPCSLTYLLLATVESFCLCPVSPVGFLPLIYSSILSSLWLPLPPHLFFNYLFLPHLLTPHFFFYYIPFLYFFQPLSHV